MQLGLFVYDEEKKETKDMLFSSITFLYYFLPVVLVAYLIAPKNFRNLILFLTSLVFYAWGEPKYVFLMLISVLIGYLSGILMDKVKKKPVMIISVLLCLGFLIYFKYTNFFITNINSLLKTELPILNVIMPIGISFYTFQIISYILDVYYGHVEKQKSFLNLATYIAMFPQLIAGPIVRYSDINEQMEDRTYTADKFADGIRRFSIGLAKKVLLANQFGELCQMFKASGEQTVVFFWVYALAASLHIYFDFSGYSDMAIGLGKILGFSFPENFNYPYMSKSITEFWRRWHMSLGTWFRDYVYIPLGGNRKGVLRHIFNILVVWFLTGFWHGAQWNFIIWGLYFAILLIVEKLLLKKFLEKSKVFSHIYTLFFIGISFVIFNANNIGELFLYLKNMFFLGDNLQNGILGRECLYYLKSYGWILVLGIMGATNYPKRIYTSIKENVWVERVLTIVEPLGILFVILLSTAYLIDGSFNPFLYFRF